MGIRHVCVSPTSDQSLRRHVYTRSLLGLRDTAVILARVWMNTAMRSESEDHIVFSFSMLLHKVLGELRYRGHLYDASFDYLEQRGIARNQLISRSLHLAGRLNWPVESRYIQLGLIVLFVGNVFGNNDSEVAQLLLEWSYVHVSADVLKEICQLLAGPEASSISPRSFEKLVFPITPTHMITLCLDTIQAAMSAGIKDSHSLFESTGIIPVLGKWSMNASVEDLGARYITYSFQYQCQFLIYQPMQS